MHRSRARSRTGGGVAAPVASSTWNPSDKSATISLSNLNKTATVDSGGGMVRGQTGRDAGVWQFEITVGVIDSWAFGLATAAATINGKVGIDADALSWSYTYNQFKWTGGAPTAYGAAIVEGNIIGVVYNGDADTITFYHNGSSQGVAFSSITGTLYPAYSSYSDAGGVCTLNTGGTAFAHAVGGATPWG